MKSLFVLFLFLSGLFSGYLVLRLWAKAFFKSYFEEKFYVEKTKKGEEKNEK